MWVVRQLSLMFALFALVLFAVVSAKSDPVTNYAGKLAFKNAVIAASGTKTAVVDMGGFSLVGIQFPTSFTGTTVTFEMSDSATGTFVPVYNSSGAVSVTIAQARFYALDPVNFQGIRYLKVVSGSSEAAERTLKLSLKGVN